MSKQRNSDDFQQAICETDSVEQRIRWRDSLLDWREPSLGLDSVASRRLLHENRLLTISRPRLVRETAQLDWFTYEVIFMARREKLEEMLQIEPNDPFLHYALAKETLGEGKQEEAVIELRTVLERFPDYHPAHFQLGQVLLELDERDEAREVVTRGIEAAKEQNDAHAVSEMTGFLEML